MEAKVEEAPEVEIPVEEDLADAELSVKQWQEEIHRWAVGKGWWVPPATESEAEGVLALVTQKLLMVHTEISEATEELRKPCRTPADLLTRLRTRFVDDSGAPCGFGVELADTMIRLADLAEFVGLNLGLEMRRKMEYNARRPHRHGGKML